MEGVEGVEGMEGVERGTWRSIDATDAVARWVRAVARLT